MPEVCADGGSEPEAGSGVSRGGAVAPADRRDGSRVDHDGGVDHGHAARTEARGGADCGRLAVRASAPDGRSFLAVPGRPAAWEGSAMPVMSMTTRLRGCEKSQIGSGTPGPAALQPRPRAPIMHIMSTSLE